MSIFDKLQAQWIWLPQQEEKVNQYVEFRHEFVLEETDQSRAVLYISVDTDYAVWVNGVFLNCNQYDDYPDKKVYDELAAGSLLKKGKNGLCILAYYQGENSFQYIKGTPRLIYAMDAGELHIASGNQAYCRESRSYKSGPVDKITGQLAFSFEYNAAGYDGWLSEEYAMDSGWVKADTEAPALRKNPESFVERPIKKLDIKDKTLSHIVSQGVFLRQERGGKTIAQLMQTDFLSHRTPTEIFKGRFEGGFKGELPSAGGIDFNPSGLEAGEGFYIVIDLGREEAGLFTLDVDACEGTVIDVSYGEHLDDLRVRAAVGGRNFAARYSCLSGRQEFTHWFKRMAGRYVELHFSNVKERLALYYAGVRPAEYPVEVKGGFVCPDHLFSRIHDVSVRTLHLCMHEHYEDTPWREQALYGMDSRMQALCGYYCFGDYEFPISSFELLGNSLGEDGYQQICAPTEFHMTIPSFNMAWIVELGDYLLYSGNVERTRALLPKVKKMLEIYLDTLDRDLMPTPGGKKFWNFYEWADGLDSTEVFAGDTYKGIANRFDAPLNLFLCMALESASMIAKHCGDPEAAGAYGDYAAKIKEAFHQRFWDDKNKCYKTYIGEECSEGCIEHYAELVQALALCSGACPADLAPILRERLAEEDNHLVKTTLSYSLYKYQALMGDPRKYGKAVFDLIARDWGHMLYNSATSFWETLKGADDFEKAGSLSHGWSATPIYFFYAHILGVKPLEPGFRAFKAEPAYWVMHSAQGNVPTPYGDIAISWKAADNGELKLQAVYPEEIKMIQP